MSKEEKRKRRLKALDADAHNRAQNFELLAHGINTQTLLENGHKETA